MLEQVLPCSVKEGFVVADQKTCYVLLRDVEAMIQPPLCHILIVLAALDARRSAKASAPRCADARRHVPLATHTKFRHVYARAKDSKASG